MSMVLLDIDNDESRGPSMIPFTSDLDACDEMDGDSVAGGCGRAEISGRRTSQGSRVGSGSSSTMMDDDGSSRSGSGRSVVEKREDKEKKKHQQHRPSPSSPSQARHGSSMATSCCDGIETDDDGTNSSSNEESCSSSTSTSSPRRRHRRSASGAPTRRLSSSLNESSSSHHHQYENNLECQAYTTTHLEALRLRREAGKVDRRAYSFNDSMTNLGGGGDNDNNGTRQWKPTLDVLDANITQPDSALSIESSGTFVDVRGGTPRKGGHIDDDNEELKKQKELDITMPDLSVRDDNKVNSKALPAQTKTTTSTSLASAEKVIAHSTSCASNMSSDTTKTIKSGNVKTSTTSMSSATSASSNKVLHHSQSGGSMSARDNITAKVSKEATTTPRKRNSSISKGKSSSTTTKQSSSSNKGKSPDDNKKKQVHSPQLLEGDNNTNNTKMNQTMREYVINDLLNIDSRNQDGSATEDIDANMEEFLRIPSKLENLMIFSLAVCIDSFLYAWAMLPLKFVWGIVCIICSMVRPRGVWGVRFHRR